MSFTTTDELLAANPVTFPVADNNCTLCRSAINSMSEVKAVVVLHRNVCEMFPNYGGGTNGVVRDITELITTD